MCIELQQATCIYPNTDSGQYHTRRGHGYIYNAAKAPACMILIRVPVISVVRIRMFIQPKEELLGSMPVHHPYDTIASGG